MAHHKKWADIKAERHQQFRAQLHYIINVLELSGLNPTLDSDQSLWLQDGWVLAYQGSKTDDPGEWVWEAPGSEE